MRSLWDSVCDGHGRPDVVVGVATGGEACARYLDGSVPVFSITLRRRATATKKRARLPQLLRFLPYGVTNILRQVEDMVGELRSRPAIGQAVPDVSAELEHDIDRIRSRVRDLGARSLLVIDDAVDSGVTLSCVVSALRAALPEVSVSSAVLTHTRRQTAFRADFALFDCVLCRFPWSFDYRAE